MRENRPAPFGLLDLIGVALLLMHVAEIGKAARMSIWLPITILVISLTLKITYQAAQNAGSNNRSR